MILLFIFHHISSHPFHYTNLKEAACFVSSNTHQLQLNPFYILTIFIPTMHVPPVFLWMFQLTDLQNLYLQAFLMPLSFPVSDLHAQPLEASKFWVISTHLVISRCVASFISHITRAYQVYVCRIKSCDASQNWDVSYFFSSLFWWMRGLNLYSKGLTTCFRSIFGPSQSRLQTSLQFVFCTACWYTDGRFCTACWHTYGRFCLLRATAMCCTALPVIKVLWSKRMACVLDVFALNS
jgi:hypothetical protein